MFPDFWPGTFLYWVFEQELFFNTKNKTRATPEDLSESHLFLKPDNWCFGFFETPRHDVIDSCINQSKLGPFTVNTSY